MACFKLFCILFYVSTFLYIVESKIPETCTKTLSLCKLTPGDEKSMKFPTPVKGETGEKGFKGEIGDHRPLGIIGNEGEKGLKGAQGNPGDSLQGKIGEKGKPGVLGPRGEKGPLGSEGNIGMEGHKGQKGAPGLRGPPGSPGANGTCPLPPHVGTYRTETLSGQMCKDIFLEHDPEILHWLDQRTSESEDIPVRCIPRSAATSLTCIDLPEMDIPLKTYSLTNIHEAFWLSHDGTTFKDIYGLSRTQIEWFQKRSSTAIQTIRFHCFNIVPYSREDITKSMSVLTWNDNTIGPVPISTNPFFYSVPVENDHCSESKVDWKYTDIEIVSNSHRRVPVIDFYIRDIRNQTQEFKIELKQLCFD